MARPCKAINTQSRHNTKEESKIRQQTEDKLRGLDDNINPPKNLTKSQKKIFKFIVNELKDSGILSNLDIFILTMASEVIAELQDIQTKVNKDFDCIYDKELMKQRGEGRKIFFRICNELSLSPQSRAKIGSLIVNSQKEKDDPIVSILQQKKKENPNGYKGE